MLVLDIDAHPVIAIHHTMRAESIPPNIKQQLLFTPIIAERLELDDVVSLAGVLPSIPALSSIILINCNIDDKMAAVRSV